MYPSSSADLTATLAPAAAPARIDAAHAVLLLIAAGALMRLAVAAIIGLEEDGSYSAVIARTFSWSYFDHPPMHLWLVGLPPRLFGSDADVLLRLPFILLFAGATWLMYRVTALAFDPWAGFWAAVGLNLSALFGVPFSFFIGPDGPLFFFLLLGAWILARLLLVEPPPRRPLLWWAAAGAVGGAALLSKYSAAFFFAGAFLFLLTTPRGRAALRRSGPWIGAAVGAAAFTPVVYWNWQHDWVSFAFQGARALPSASGGMRQLLENIGAQSGYLLPWFAIALAYVLIRALARGPADPRRWFFACLAIGPILFFTAVHYFQRGMPHWTMPGWLFAFPLLGAAIVELSPRWRAVVRAAAIVFALVTVTIVGALAAQARFGVLDRPLDLLSARTGLRHARLVELLDWDGVKPVLAARGLGRGENDFIAGATWRTTGRLALVLGRAHSVVCLCREPQHFQFLQDLRELAGRNALVIGPPGVLRSEQATLEAQFERLEPLEPIVLTRAGRPAIELHVWRGVRFAPATGQIRLR